MARTDALWRIGALIWGLVAVFILQAAIILGFVYMVIDVVMTLLLGDGWGTDNLLAEWGMRFVEWPYNLTIFALFGDGELQWLP